MEVILSIIGAGACLAVGVFGFCMYCVKWYPRCSCSRERRRRNALLVTCTKIRFSKRNSEDSIPDTCPVCLDDFKHRERILLTPCRHGYHRNCLLGSLAVNPLCPLCKSVVSQTAYPQSDHDAERTSLLRHS